MRHILLAISFLIPGCISAQIIITPADLEVNAKAKYVHITDPWIDIDRDYTFDIDGKLLTAVTIEHTVINKEDIYKRENIYADDVIIMEKVYYDNVFTNCRKFIYKDDKLILEEWVDPITDSVFSTITYCYEEGKLRTKQYKVNSEEFINEEITYDDKNHLKETKSFYNDELSNIEKCYKDKDYEIVENYDVQSDSLRMSSTTYCFFDNKSKVIERGWYENCHYGKCEYSIDTFEYLDNVITKALYWSYGEIDFERYFDEKGNITKEIRYDNGGETTIFKNKYNSYGDLIKVVRIKDGKVVGKKKIKIKYWK